MNTNFRGTFAKVSIELTEAGWEYLNKNYPNASAREKLRAVTVMADHTIRNDDRFKVVDVKGEEIDE